MSKRGLGRGLGALIPEVDAASGSESRESAGSSLPTVPVDSITPNPSQPRKEFRDAELRQLVDSIRQQGLLQPVVVRELNPGRYQLIAGERRWRAAQEAGFDEIPVVIRDTPDEELLPLALIENLLRENLNPIEEARAFQKLSEEAGWTQDRIAEEVSRGRSHVANTMRLLKLPIEIREDVADGRLTAGHARSILACATEDEMFALRDRILAQGLTVREAETVVSEKPVKKARKRASRGEVSPETRDVENRLEHIFGTAVQLRERKGRGKLSLEFYSYDDLNRLLELLYKADKGVH